MENLQEIREHCDRATECLSIAHKSFRLGKEAYLKSEMAYNAAVLAADKAGIHNLKYKAVLDEAGVLQATIYDTTVEFSEELLVSSKASMAIAVKMIDEHSKVLTQAREALAAAKALAA